MFGMSLLMNSIENEINEGEYLLSTATADH